MVVDSPLILTFELRTISDELLMTKLPEELQEIELEDVPKFTGVLNGTTILEPAEILMSFATRSMVFEPLSWSAPEHPLIRRILVIVPHAISRVPAEEKMRSLSTYMFAICISPTVPVITSPIFTASE